MTARAARHQVDMGRWERSHLGVYRVAGAPASWRQDLMAACLAAGEGAMASHRSAARLWGLIGEEVLEVSILRPGCHRLPGVVVHRSTDLHTTRALRCEGIPVTPPARTLVDLGAVVHERVVQWALEAALGRQLVSADDLRSTLEAVGRKGRRGAGVLRRLVESTLDGELGSESVLEARMWRVFRGSRSPRTRGAARDTHWPAVRRSGRLRLSRRLPGHRGRRLRVPLVGRRLPPRSGPPERVGGRRLDGPPLHLARRHPPTGTGGHVDPPRARGAGSPRSWRAGRRQSVASAPRRKGSMPLTASGGGGPTRSRAAGLLR